MIIEVKIGHCDMLATVDTDLDHFAAIEDSRPRPRNLDVLCTVKKDPDGFGFVRVTVCVGDIVLSSVSISGIEVIPTRCKADFNGSFSRSGSCDPKRLVK